MIYTALALFSFPAFALPPGFFTTDTLSSVLTQEGCAPENVKTREVFLRSPAGQPPDLLLYCADHCGGGGCSYHLFLRNQEADDLYRYAGNFAGHYTILRTVHGGYYDLKVEQRMGSERRLEETLRYKAHRYQ